MSDTSQDPFDRRALLHLMGHDPALLAEVVGLFTADAGGALDAIDHTLTLGNPAQVRLAAHKLHGTLSNFFAPRATALVRAIEEQALRGDISQGEGLARRLREEVDRLLPALAALVQETRSHLEPGTETDR